MISEKLWLHSTMASPKLFNIVKIYCFPFRHVIIMLHVRLAKPSIGFSWFYRIAINSPPSTTSLYQSYSALGVLSWYSLMHKKPDSTIFKKCISKKFRKWFNFLICILPDYVPHESQKEFWKNSHFENTRAGFLLRCQNSLRQNTPKMMHFQAWKNKDFKQYSVVAFDPIKIFTH